MEGHWPTVLREGAFRCWDPELLRNCQLVLAWRSLEEASEGAKVLMTH